MPRWPLAALPFLVLLPAGPLAAQEPSEACRRFDASEADGRLQVSRRLAAIDAAAARGDIAAFCEATKDLVFVYAAMRDAGLACSPERARRWEDALAQTEGALAGTCP